MDRRVRRLLLPVWMVLYRATLALLWPASRVRAALAPPRPHPRSVLHISSMVHIPYRTTRILRRFGVRADYLAVGDSTVWDKSDYQIVPSFCPLTQAVREWRLFWNVVSRYEVLHLHFLMTMSVSGWELPLLERLGRRLVFHYRGCEARDPDLNARLHPEGHLCQACDYDREACTDPLVRRRRRLARRYGDVFLATTPDLRDFVPEAVHFPFFAPETEAAPPPRTRRDEAEPLRLVHATNHPGLEGTDRIREAVDRLREAGHAIDFVCLRGVPPERVMEELGRADLSIGKMKMGYYANAQIESMIQGVPAITHVRPEFMTDALREAGFIFTTLDRLEETLAYYLEHPDALEAKRRIARSSILALHDNAALARRLIALYFPDDEPPASP